MASPFFSVYLLRELKISYSAFTIIITAAVVTSLITQRYWGIFADKYGNIKILKLSAFLITLIPLGWLVSSNLYYLFLLQLLAGFVWAGFTISSSNFIYDVATSTKRERCIAYFNFLSGAGLAIGSLIGGTIYGILPPLLGSRFLTLFLISSVVRLVSAVLIRYFTHEVKNVQKAQVREFLFDLSGLRFIGLLSKELLVKGKK